MVLIKKLLAVFENKNTRNVFLNIAFAFLVKGGSMFIALFTTPAYITYFSNDAVLGVWFTLLSILAWMLNFDLGVGNGVRNKLVGTFANQEITESKRYISSAYIFLSCLAILMFFAGTVFFRFFSWTDLLGITTPHISETVLLHTVLIVFASIMLQFVLRLITSICYAMQYSYVASLLTLCTNVLLLFYVSIANARGANGSITTLAIVYLLAVNLPLLFVTVFLFATKLKTMTPSIRYFSMPHAKTTIRLGGVFLYLQLVAMLLDNTSNFLISNLLGAEQVVEYQLYYKIFYLICSIASLTLVPMWSAITKAWHEKCYAWLRKGIFLMFGLVGIVFILEFLLIPLAPWLFNVWLGENVLEINYITATVFAILGGMSTWTTVCSYIANGLNKTKIEAITLTIGVVISLTFSFAFAKIWGTFVVVTVGVLLGHVPFCVGQTIWTLKFCRKLKENTLE